MSGHAWTPNDDAYIVAHYQTHTYQAMGDHIGVSRNAVEKRFRGLVARGLVDRTLKYTPARSWADDRDRLVGMLQDGFGVAYAASKLGRGITGVYDYVNRVLGGLDAVRANDIATVRTAVEVARLFGVHHHVILAWIRKKWLKARRDGSGAKRHGRSPHKKKLWRISDEAIIAFMQQRDTWPAWEVSRITDLDWREYAADVRRDDQWLSAIEVARKFKYADGTIRQWAIDGWLDNVRKVHVNNTWYFWSTDLAGFVPPLERQTRKAA